jgi:hypothetical protein
MTIVHVTPLFAMPLWVVPFVVGFGVISSAIFAYITFMAFSVHRAERRMALPARVNKARPVAEPARQSVSR